MNEGAKMMATAPLLSLKPPPPLQLSPFRNPRIQHHSISRTLKLIPSASFGSYSTPPETECPVPLDQQPVNEYQSLSTSAPFSWASADFPDYCYRLFVTGASFALFLGLPVSWYGSVGIGWDPIQRVLGSVSSGVFVITLAVVRMYLGWAYVGNRLLSATVEYEETGWYDGQIWVKTPEVLARDRLLGSYSVKPVLGRLKNTLLSLGLSLFMCIGVLVINTQGSQTPNAQISSGGKVVHGVYNDESARSFEPDAFCGESTLS
jgi:hypothetical protein